VLRESQNRLPVKSQESSEMPESPCLLNVTPQENYQSVKAQVAQVIAQVSQPLSATAARSASQGTLLKGTKPKSAGRGVVRGKTPHKENASPLKRSVMFSPQAQKMTLEQYEEKMNHDHLRSAVTALNEKLKFYENVDQERANV